MLEPLSLPYTMRSFFCLFPLLTIFLHLTNFLYFFLFLPAYAHASFFFIFKASPFPPHSDLFSTPDLVDNSNRQFARPTVDVSGAYYGVFPNPGYENMISPVSAKRSRDGFDEVLTDTLGSFALEAKKKRLDPSYNEGKYASTNRIMLFLKKDAAHFALFPSKPYLVFPVLIQHDTILGGG